MLHLVKNWGDAFLPKGMPGELKEAVCLGESSCPAGVNTSCRSIG